MELFIDRMRFQRGGIVLPIYITDPGLPAPPSEAALILCHVDTGFAGELFCWRLHLEQAGLDPDDRRLKGRTQLRATLHADKPLSVPARRADVWLTSNRDEWLDRPLQIELEEGVVFRDEDPPMRLSSTLKVILGMRALRRARVRVEIDFARQHWSLRTPSRLGSER